jgi:hypothetical protein
MAAKGEIVTTNRGRPLLYKNNKALKSKVDDYFKQCNTLRDLPTITELAVYLGTSRETLREYKARPEFVDTIKEAMAKCEAALEKRALLGGLNATMAIFSLKNNYGWIDKQEVDNRHEMVQPILSNVADKDASDTTPDVIDLT